MVLISGLLLLGHQGGVANVILIAVSSPTSILGEEGRLAFLSVDVFAFDEVASLIVGVVDPLLLLLLLFLEVSAL